MVQDPVCGMQIGEGEAAGKVGYCGMAYYFCSVFCLAAFVENPEKYTRGKKEPCSDIIPSVKVVMLRSVSEPNHCGGGQPC